MIFINPGSGAVKDATEQNAIQNIKHFITDLGMEVKFVRMPDQDDDGRFCFQFFKNNRCVEIDMPGLPLEQVRYMGLPQNIWHFPRLYVDGSSWVWCYALDCAKSTLNGENDECGGAE